MNFSLEQHVIYRSSTESSYSFPELADMHLLLVEWNGNFTHAVRRYRKKKPNRSAKSLYVPLIVDSRRREHFTELGWDCGCPRSVREVQIERQTLEVAERQPTITANSLLAHTATSLLLYTVHYDVSSYIPVTFSMWKTCNVNGLFNSRPKTLCL
jgi:hypothetical protein